MVLNYIFVGFFAIAFVIALFNLIVTGDFTVFNNVVNAMFQQSKSGFEISLYLSGMLCLWMGVMNIAERSGMINVLAKISSPLLSVLFPSIPKNSTVTGNIVMNISANLLGLDNAATPIGLKAMQGLQELNKNKSEASDAMIMFISLNASGLTIIPTSIMAYRMIAGSANPSDVFIPILIATTMSTLTAVVAVGIRQKIDFMSRQLLVFILLLLLFVSLAICGSVFMDAELFSSISKGISSFLLMSVIVCFIVFGVKKRVNVYDAFIDGAKNGFSVAVSIIPYMIAILVGVGVFRASGAMDIMMRCISWFFDLFDMDTRFVDAIPTILMKPLSGSGARGLMVDAMNTYGADSFVGRLCSTVQGASDTTFYIMAVYFGAVKIKNTRYTAGLSLLADFVGAMTAIIVTYLFFG